MRRTLRHLLIALALLFAQQAAQLHALTHLKYDLTKLAKLASGEGGVPPISHPAEQCIAFHAVDSALANSGGALEPARISLPVVAHFDLPLPFPPRIAFDSRAPPALS